MWHTRVTERMVFCCQNCENEKLYHACLNSHVVVNSLADLQYHWPWCDVWLNSSGANFSRNSLNSNNDTRFKFLAKRPLVQVPTCLAEISSSSKTIHGQQLSATHFGRIIAFLGALWPQSAPRKALDSVQNLALKELTLCVYDRYSVEKCLKRACQHYGTQAITKYYQPLLDRYP